MADIRFINPETLAKPPSYTHVVEVVGACRTVHISGQLGIDLAGNVVGDFRAQAVQVFENLKAALASVGATFADVVKLNSYLADIADLADVEGEVAVFGVPVGVAGEGEARVEVAGVGAGAQLDARSL